MKKVAIGSKNPVKVNAIKNAFELMLPGIAFEFVDVEAQSGVSDQPFSVEESINGATNRAKRALNSLHADYGVGLEGGIEQVGEDYFVSGWAAVVDQGNVVSCGSSVRVPIPKDILDLVNSGLELGDACDKYYGLENSKHKSGFFGQVTNNLITRERGYQDAVIAAMSKLVS